jgi:hypothetical protein
MARASAAIVGGLPRTEVEVMADAAWRLVERRVLGSDAATVRAAATALGISVDDVRLASIRQERRPYRPPRSDATPSPADRVDTQAQSFARRRLHTVKPQGQDDEHWCGRHDGGRGAWLPKSEFAVKDHRTGALKFACRPCLAEYQRQRYLTVEEREHLRARLTFELGPDDAGVGTPCPTCQRLLEVGDTVATEGRLHHADCEVD